MVLVSGDAETTKMRDGFAGWYCTFQTKRLRSFSKFNLYYISGPVSKHRDRKYFEGSE